MKFSENWLRHWVSPKLSTQELAEQLTMAGLEIGCIQPACPKFTHVVVGRIESLSAHPNSDKLQLCDIDIGDKHLIIVTAAKNVTVGAKVPLALVGAHLPGIHKAGETLKAAEIRKVNSPGMLCSTEELGLGPAAGDGIWLLPQEAKTGEDLWQYLQLDDQILEVELTPNRGDCLCILGIAREVATLNQLPLTIPEVVAVKSNTKESFAIENKASQACPRYVGRLIRNINQRATTPMWMQERLRRADIRSIHPVVDCLNYVMLELGQPMHAFDADKVHDKIVIRHAHNEESIVLLDGKTQVLHSDTLVIADSQNVLAMAGIMGGLDSAVSANTQHIFLESALFDSEQIAGKGRRYGLHTDSQYRFERGVDPQLQAQAMQRATALITEICGGDVGDLMDVCSLSDMPQTQEMTLDYDNVIRLLGSTVNEATVIDVIERLGCLIKEDLKNEFGMQWLIQTPSFRYDLKQEVDLIEEIARVVGYNQIPSHLPLSKIGFTGQSETQISTFRLKRFFVDLGYQEVITYSFVDEQVQNKLFPHEKALRLLNPISQDMGVMRVSLWPSLLNILKYNQNRQQQTLSCFEMGARYYFRDEKLIQEPVLSGLVCAPGADFFEVKHHIENLWQLLGYRESLTFKTMTNVAACHPGQCAQILWQGNEVGVLGKLHPQMQGQLDITGAVFLFELKLSALMQIPLPAYHRPSRFPEIRRDIAVIVDEALPGDSLINHVRKSAGEMLRDAKIFDVYMGKGIDSGRKSVAIGLILQHSSRTLVDQEVDSIVHTVVSDLEKEFNAKLRD